MGFIVVVHIVADNILIEEGSGDTDDSVIIMKRDNDIYYILIMRLYD